MKTIDFSLHFFFFKSQKGMFELSNDYDDEEKIKLKKNYDIGW